MSCSFYLCNVTHLKKNDELKVSKLCVCVFFFLCQTAWCHFLKFLFSFPLSRGYFLLRIQKKVNTWWNTPDYETYMPLHIHNHPKGKIVDVMMASFSQCWAPAHILWVSSRSGEAGPRILGFFTPNSSRTFPSLRPTWSKGQVPRAGSEKGSTNPT